MIKALRYEPHGQRFEPHEQQRGEPGQRHIHLHLNLHVHLNLGARRTRVRRFLQPTTARVTTIFAAFIGALSMALSFFIMTINGSFHFMGPHIDLANTIMFIGALLGSGAVLLGGLPLVVETWRSTPRSRLLLSTPLLVFLILTALIPWGVVNGPLLLTELLILAAIWRPTWHKRFFFALLALVILTIPLTSLLAGGIRQLFILLSPWLWGINGNPMNTLLFYGIPLVSTIAIVCAIRRAKLSDKLLRFTVIPSLLVVLGMLLMIGGMLLWGGTVLFFLPDIFPQILALLTLPYNSWLLQLLGMIIALIVIQRAIFALSRSQSHAEASPKDDSPADSVSSRERGYYPIDPTRD